MAEQIIPFHTRNQNASRKIERRAWVRIHSGEHAVWIMEDADAALLGIIRDISSGGMALILRQSLEPGTVLIVELETKASWPRRVPVHVMHSTEEATDRWVIGCTFASPLTEKELRDFLDE